MTSDGKKRGVSLKAVAEYVGLTPGTVSTVLNNSPASECIPQATKDRIFAAAQALNYRPNFLARSLRTKRTYTVAVMAREIGDPYTATVIHGIEAILRERDYIFVTGVHRDDPALFDAYSTRLMERGVEGFVILDKESSPALPLPTVSLDVDSFARTDISVVRDPLKEMGAVAAKSLLAQIESGNGLSAPQWVV